MGTEESGRGDSVGELTGHCLPYEDFGKLNTYDKLCKGQMIVEGGIDS